MDHQITLPSKPRVVSEEGMQGIYEIDSLYPGYGHTLGNSLRRIILSSLPGAAVTNVKIEDVQHEFATIEGVRESVMEILLNLKSVHFTLHGDEPQTIRLAVKGP
jgi:DNA-directed RNA polymerase subunit alpha